MEANEKMNTSRHIRKKGREFERAVEGWKNSDAFSKLFSRGSIWSKKS
jgi:hypothetical protein